MGSPPFGAALELDDVLPVRRHERATGAVECARDVLREATAVKGKVQTRGVAFALWVLRGRCLDDWLVAVWNAAGSDHDMGRSQGLHSAYNGIAAGPDRAALVK